MSLTPEEWRPVGTHPALYEVSNLGRVRSLDHVNIYYRSDGMRIARQLRGKILKPTKSYGKNSRQHVSLWSEHVARQAMVHRLVLEAFVGPCPPGQEGCHWDGDSFNNRLSNLRWDTPVANAADKKRHGTHLQGDDISWSKLDAADIAEIRAMAGIVSQEALAKEYGVGQPQISRIVARKEWKHI